MKTPGLIVAPLTPFTSDLKVDEPALERQIDYVVEDCRATMVVAAGVETQEYTYLGLEERKELIRRTIELVDSRVPVMVGISHPRSRPRSSWRTTPKSSAPPQCSCWRRCGRSPGRRREGDLIAYFEAIGRETELPITLYLNPGPGADVSIPTPSRSRSCRRCSSSRKARAILPACRGSSSRSIVPATPATSRPCRCCSRHWSWAAPARPCRRPAREIARHIVDAFLAKDYERAAELQLQFALFPVEVDASRPRAGHEGGDEADRHSGRRALPALCAARAATR